jgi:xanthosine utilization system XapX-like protein
MRKQLFALVAGAALVAGWLVARHFVQSGHPYVAVGVMFLVGLALGTMVIPAFRSSSTRKG